MARPAHARGGTCYLCAAPHQYANLPPLSHNAPAFPAISAAPAKPRGAACRRHPRRDAPTSLPIPAKSRRADAAAGEQRGGRRARVLHPSVSRPGEGLDDGARGQRAAGEQRGGRRARALHPSVSRPGEGLDDGARARRAGTRQAQEAQQKACGSRRAAPGAPLPFGARAPALPFSSVSRPAHAPLPAPPAFPPPPRKKCPRGVHARRVVLY